MDARECDFLEPRGGDTRDLADEIRNRQALRRPARGRDDAVRTTLLAPGLRANRECRAARDARFDGRAARTIAVAGLGHARPEGRAYRCGESERLGKIQLLAVADDSEQRQRGDFILAARRVAAGRDDLRV